MLRVDIAIAVAVSANAKILILKLITTDYYHLSLFYCCVC